MTLFPSNPRKYGFPPFSVAVIHGGPGAAGELATLALELSSSFSPGLGILEPLQTAQTLDGQIAELKKILEDNALLPVTLIGFSWGAWLSFILAARYPSLVERLVLVASGPFRECYARQILPVRLSRLDESERNKAELILASLNEQGSSLALDRDLARLGLIFSRCDAFDPIGLVEGSIENAEAGIKVQAEIYQSIWNEASHLRRTGELLQMGRKIQCPVVALHGDWDPHPAEGVREPLSSVLGSFQFILIQNCGHKPWFERQAKDIFYSILKKLII